MKYFSDWNLLQFTWDQVVCTFWHRYPNPQSKHVLSEDVLERRVENNKLFTKRLICKTNSIPKWGERFAQGNKYVYVVEESILDMAAKTFVTYTRNIGLQKIMSIHEKCTYSVCPKTNILTQCHKQAWINSQWFGFRYLLCNFGHSRIKKNAAKATAGFNFVLNELYTPIAIEGMNFEIEKTKTEVIRDSAKRAKELVKSKAEQASELAKMSAEKASQMAKTGAECAKAKVISPVDCSSESKKS